MAADLHEIEERLDGHGVRITALEASIYGDSSKLLRGHEERLQLLERTVSDLAANWSKLVTQLQTLAAVGRVIAWLLGVVGIVGVVDIIRALAGG